MRQCQFNLMENKFSLWLIVLWIFICKLSFNIILQSALSVISTSVTQKVSKTFPEFSTHGKQQFPYIIKKFPKSRACIIIYTLLYCDCDDICRIRDDIEAKMSPYCKKNRTKKCTHRKCNSNYWVTLPKIMCKFTPFLRKY